MLSGIDDLKLGDRYEIPDCAAWASGQRKGIGYTAALFSEDFKHSAVVFMYVSQIVRADAMGGLLCGFLIYCSCIRSLQTSPPALLKCGFLPRTEISLNHLSLAPWFSRGRHSSVPRFHDFSLLAQPPALHSAFSVTGKSF